MSGSQIEQYLASDEELRLSFSASDVASGDDSTDTHADGYQIGATDRRIIYIGSNGDFKDISYSHISSIETETETDSDPRTVLKLVGGFAIAVGFLSFIHSALIAILNLLAGGVIYYAATQGGEPESRERIKLITGDEQDQQITITLTQETNKNIPTEITRIMREGE